MRKDYLAVSALQAGCHETEFVEAYWTQHWTGRALEEAAKAQVERREERRLIEPYLAGLPPGSRLLDGGCGPGAWTLYYTARGFDVTGLDLSRETIERLQARFPEHPFLVGDLRKTPFEDASFDAYFSWGTFEHFEEGLGACFEEARRILKPGGYLFVSVPFQNRRHLRRDQRALWRWDESFDREAGYRSPMRFYQWRLTRPELAREFELHGFRMVRVVPIQKHDGLHRAVKHDLGLRPGSAAYRLARALLSPVIPRNEVAHMILGIGCKR